jgi:hypothetical protein
MVLAIQRHGRTLSLSASPPLIPAAAAARFAVGGGLRPPRSMGMGKRKGYPQGIAKILKSVVQQFIS